MNTAVEKFSARDKAALSKETILSWYRAKNREKLDSLKDEIKQLAYSERERLRARIIENTKRELEKYKDLTDEQREMQAKQFADEFIKAIMGKEDIEDVIKRYEYIENSGGRQALIKKWMNNNPGKKIEILKDDPKYLALRYIADRKARTEAVVLLSLIEKTEGMGGREKALAIYMACRKEDGFDLKKLRSYFSKEKAAGKLGFYYGTRKILWKANLSWYQKSAPAAWRQKEDAIWRANGFFGRPFAIGLVNVTGWWAVDIDETDFIPSSVKSIIKETAEGDLDRKNNYLKLLKADGYVEGEDIKSSIKNVKGDEWLGKNLADALPGIRHELIGTKEEKGAKNDDSGLDAGDEQKVLDVIKDADNLSNDTYKHQASKVMYEWLSRNAVNKWVKLGEKEHGLMTFLFGEGCGNYLYRYSPKTDRIYIVRIEGIKVDPKHFGGKITVKNNSLDVWESHDRENTDTLLAYIADNLTTQEVNSELLDYKIKEESPEKISEDEKLEKTKGLTGAFFSVKNVEYENIDKDYVEKLTEKLKAELEKRGMKKEKAREFAELRASRIKDEIYKKIEADEVIEEARKENSKVILEIKVNANDEVAVKLSDLKLRKDWMDKLKKKADEKHSPEALENNYMKQLEKRVEKYAGRFTPFVMYFIEKFFKVKDKVKDMVSGKPSLFTAALSFLGFKTGKDIILQRKVNEKAFEKIPPADKKSYSLTKKMVFDGDITLKNKRIIIPKGKGFIPGGKIKLKLDSRYTVEYDPEKEKEAALKKQTGFKGIFDRLKASKEKYKDNEVTIEPGTVVPSKTEIPKGSKIERV